MARWKDRWAAVASRCRETKTLTTRAELVDRAVDVAPAPSHLHIGLVHLPAVADGVPAGPGSVGE
jgi:hypothetical protein